MFKKSLLATALFATAGAANAASVSVAHALDAGGDSVVRVSTQYAASSAAAAVADVKATVTLAAAYTAGDIITITVNGGTLDDTVTGTANGILNAIVADDGLATPVDTIAFGLLSQDGNSLTYRVTSAAGTTSGLAPVFNIPLKKDHISSAAGVTVKYAAETSTGVTIDASAANSATVVAFFDQYSNKVTTKASAKIDVAAEREAFVDTDTATVGLQANEDIVLTVTDLQVGDDVNTANTSGSDLADLVATSVKATYTVSGDFSWMTTTTTSGGLDTTAGELTVTAAGVVSGLAFGASNQELVFTVTAADLTGAVTLDFTVPQNSFKIPVQTFTIDEVKTYDTNKTESVADMAAGSWTLNGANVNVPYMPYGSNISQIIYITNTASAGDVSVVATDEMGTEYDLGVLGSAITGVTKLSGLIKDAMPADFSGKVSLDITVNAPDSAVSVYSAYNVGGSDRGTVTSSQYKK